VLAVLKTKGRPRKGNRNADTERMGAHLSACLSEASRTSARARNGSGSVTPKGFPKDEAERLIEEYRVARKRNHNASERNLPAVTRRLHGDLEPGNNMVLTKPSEIFQRKGSSGVSGLSARAHERIPIKQPCHRNQRSCRMEL
jgi:hypothetical protein